LRPSVVVKTRLHNLRLFILQNELREVPRAWNLDLC